MRAITREPGERGSGRLEICERDHDGVRVIGVVGDLDLGAAAEFCARVDAARAGGSTRLLLDLTQLGFCDSSGLRALIGAAEFLPLHPSMAEAQRYLGHLADGAGRAVGPQR